MTVDNYFIDSYQEQGIAKESTSSQAPGEVLVQEATSQKVVDRIDLAVESDEVENPHCSIPSTSTQSVSNVIVFARNM